MHYLQQPVFIRKTRLQSVQHWMLYPIFLSSLYLCVSLSHALSIPNPRVDSHTYVPHLPDTVILETQPPEMAFQGIWLAIHPVSQGILIQVPGEIPLVWDKNPSTSAEISLQLTGMLKRSLQQLYLKTALSQRVAIEASMVRIAADRSLRYEDVQPALYALAEAGFSQYAFEVQLSHKVKPL